jgi:hypothetical protein
VAHFLNDDGAALDYFRDGYFSLTNVASERRLNQNQRVRWSK